VSNALTTQIKRKEIIRRERSTELSNLPVRRWLALPPNNLLMPIGLTEDERVALIDLVVGTIEHDLSPHSPRIQRLRGILAKFRPVSGNAEPSGNRRG